MVVLPSNRLFLLSQHRTMIQLCSSSRLLQRSSSSKLQLNRQQQRLRRFRSSTQTRSTVQTRTTTMTTMTALFRHRRTSLLPIRRSLRLYRSHPRRHRRPPSTSHSPLQRRGGVDVCVCPDDTHNILHNHY